MKRSIEVQAKTIDQAIEQALEQLGASYDEVTVEVLSEGGLFKKAKVQVTMKASESASESATAPKRESAPTAAHKAERAPEKTDKKETDKGTKSKTESKHADKPKSDEPRKVITNSGEMPEKFAKTLAFTTTLLELLGNDARAEGEITEKSFNININGGNVGMIIGKGGEVMNAIQTIVTTIAIANSHGEHKRVIINIEDYKQRREETLKALAQKKAEKVKETGRYIKLEPMSARERAIIHAALQDIEGIRSYSTGKDPYRCLCIAPADGDKKSSSSAQ